MFISHMDQEIAVLLDGGLRRVSARLFWDMAITRKLRNAAWLVRDMEQVNRLDKQLSVLLADAKLLLGVKK